MTLQGTAMRFGLIGVLATVVHLITGTVLIKLQVAPLIANICGFVTAFGFSFFGHHYFSFAGHGNRLGETLNRFIWVATFGFGINQAILALLLRAYPGISASVSASASASALIISTLTAAFTTFLMSYFWAFRKQSTDKPEAIRDQ